MTVMSIKIAVSLKGHLMRHKIKLVQAEDLTLVLVECVPQTYSEKGKLGFSPALMKPTC